MFSLSGIRRFNGHNSCGVSVLFHSVVVSILVWRATHDPVAAQQALFHDAPEIYTGDIASPVKQHPQFAFFRENEDKNLKTIYTAFGIPAEISPLVHEMDMKCYVREADEFNRATFNSHRPLHGDTTRSAFFRLYLAFKEMYDPATTDDHRAELIEGVNDLSIIIMDKWFNANYQPPAVKSLGDQVQSLLDMLKGSGVDGDIKVFNGDDPHIQDFMNKFFRGDLGQ